MSFKNRVEETQIGELLYYYDKLSKKGIVQMDKVGNIYHIVVTDFIQLDNSKINKGYYEKILRIISQGGSNFAALGLNNNQQGKQQTKTAKDKKKSEKLYLSDIKKDDLKLFIAIYNKITNKDVIVGENVIKDDFFLFCKNIHETFEVREVIEIIKKAFGLKFKLSSSDELDIRNSILLTKIVLILSNYDNSIQNKGQADYTYNINNFLKHGYKKYLPVDKNDIRHLGKKIISILKFFEDNITSKNGIFKVAKILKIESILTEKEKKEKMESLIRKDNGFESLINSF